MRGMNMRAEMSARRADYTAWANGRPERKPLPEGLDISPCAGLESLAEILGALRKLKHEKSFLSKVFEARDKQLFPRDLLVATVPTKRGGRRPVGVIRRSLQFQKQKRSADLSIDFVWVIPDLRSSGLGRQLMAAGLLAGKPKDVRLQIAGSEANKAALGLYTSLGFVWEAHEEKAKEKTEMILTAEKADLAVAKLTAARAAQATPTPTPPPMQPSPCASVGASLCVPQSDRVALEREDEPAGGLEGTAAEDRRPPHPPKHDARCEQQRAVRLSAG